MFDRNTVIGLALSSVLFMIFMYVSFQKDKKYRLEHPPVKEVVVEKKTSTTDSKTTTINNNNVVANTIVNDSIKNIEASGKYGVFANSVNTPVKTFTVENEVMKITFSNKGASVKQVELKKFKTWDKKPLLMTANNDNYYSFNFQIKNNLIINSGEMNFESDNNNIVLKGDEKKSISFKLKAADGQYVEQLYTLSGNSYVVDQKVNFVNLNNILPDNIAYVELNWIQKCRQLEYKVTDERRYSGLYFQNRISKSVYDLIGQTPESKSNESEIGWIGYKQQFFSTILSSSEGMSGKVSTDFDPKDTTINKKYVSTLNLPLTNSANSSINLEWYYGPNDYTALRKMDKGYENLIPLASSMAIFKWMGFVNKYAIIPIFNLLKNFTHNYGIIIFILALIIKLVLTPFTLQQSRYSAKMQILKPELDKLKEKYGDDQQKFSAEQMKIMSKVGMSPLSGCLPMLLQMPILISMYNFFPASIELRQASFLWAHDLSTYDSILSFPPIFGMNHLSLFTILMTITSLINAWITPQPQSQDNPGMKYMPYIFPFMLFFMFNSFSAALTYYYLLFNVFSIIQVWVIKKFFIDEKKLEAEIHAKKNAPAKKGGWMEKLENYTKEQQAKAKAQQRGK